MKRARELFDDLPPKLYLCNICKEMLTASDFDKNKTNPSRDGLQRQCKECRVLKSNPEPPDYCDICNKLSQVKYTYEEAQGNDSLIYKFCRRSCYKKWIDPNTYYE